MPENPPHPAARRRATPAQAMALRALGLWVVALPFLGLAMSQGGRGLEILFMGGLGPVGGVFAWYANPAFFWALVRMHGNKTGAAPALLAVVLSLDTFRHAAILLGASELSERVFGYGWGAVLWFAALALMLAASGTRSAEIRSENGDEPTLEESLRPVGLALFALVIVGSVGFAIHDRWTANSAERERLAWSVAFKRGRVCGAETPNVDQPIRLSTGVLQLERNWDNSSLPFGDVRELLEWGVPVVRLADRDYSYLRVDGEFMLTSVSASGPADATLLVEWQKKNQRSSIRARVTEGSAGRIVADQTWVEQPNRGHCPEYALSPEPHEQPRKLITQSLSLQPGPDVGATPKPPDPAEVITAMVAAADEKQEESAGKKALFPDNDRSRHWQCPADVGWWVGRGSPTDKWTGAPFMVGDRAYYPTERDAGKAICVGPHVYLYQSYSGSDKTRLMLEKRRLSDFHKAWDRTVLAPGLSGRSQEWSIDTLDERSDGFTIHLVDAGGKQRVMLTAGNTLAP